MSVIRVHKSKDFTTMSNHHLRNKDLSLSAKGLMSVILSLPDDWKYSISGLAAISKEGERAIRSSLKELREHGYVVVTRTEPQKGNNRVSYSYDIFEVPTYQVFSTKPQVAEHGGCEGVQGEHVQPEHVQTSRVLNTYNQISDSQDQQADNPAASSSNLIVISSTKDKEKKKKEEDKEFVEGVIAYLNEKTGSAYRPSSAYIRKLVLARRGEGFSVDDFKTVIDTKASQWRNDSRMAQYLRPSTLFAPSHFEEYQNESAVNKRESDMLFTYGEDGWDVIDYKEA